MLLLFSLMTVMAADPIITVRSLDADGIRLLPHGSSEFTAAAQTVASIEERKALLPYTVLLKNTTNRNVIAYSVRWTPTGVDGIAVKPQLLTPRNFITFRGGAAIAAGESKLVSFVDGLTLPPEAQNPALHRRMLQAAEFYRSQRSIEISLELVILDDGTAIGPDQDGKLAILKAWVDAERDFSRQALDVKDPEAFASMVRQIRGEGFQMLGPEYPKTLNSLYLAAEISTEYEACFRFARSYFALQVTDWIDQTDVKSAQQRLSSITGTKQYPTIHR